MTNLADYEQWDYRKIFKIDPCNCEDEECNTFILSVRKTHAITQYDDDQKWVKLAILDNDLLVDLIKNCISTHESDGEYLDDRERLEQMLEN